MGPQPRATASGDLVPPMMLIWGGPQLPIDIEDDPEYGQDGSAADEEEDLCVDEHTSMWAMYTEA